MRLFSFFIALIIPSLLLSQSEKDTEIWEPIPQEVYSITDSAPPDDYFV